jgi:hypothetical protein
MGRIDDVHKTLQRRQSQMPAPLKGFVVCYLNCSASSSAVWCTLMAAPS